MIKKKILVLTLIAFNFVFMMVGCSNEPDENKTNEDPLLLEDTLNINDFTIKHLDSQYSNEISYIITPTKFDLDLLEAENYKMEITLTYDVHYNLHGYETLEEWQKHIEEYTANLEKQQREIEKQDGVILCTMHSSKGLEFPIVFIPEANEGITPYQKAVMQEEIEEERRLFYVAMTRAKELLYIFSVKERFHKNLEVSRFVREFTETNK